MKELQNQVPNSSKPKKVSPKVKVAPIIRKSPPIAKEECKVKNEGSTDEIPAKKKRGRKPKDDSESSIASKVIVKKPRGRPKRDTKTVKLEAGEVN